MMSGHSRQGNQRPRVMIALALLVSLQIATPAWAWGRLGHRVISRIAEKHLNSKTKAGIAVLLEPGESLADASTWADENRRRLPKTAPWHYIDIPLNEPRYDARFSGDVPTKGCIVDKIHEFHATLKDPARSVEERRFALRFLIHLIEDLHMPMHVGDNHNKGGNLTQVRFFTRGSNLHSVWDTVMIEWVSHDENRWLADLAALASPEALQAAMKGTVEDWATESLLAAREAYKVPESGERLKSGQKLADAYLNANLPVVRRRLHQASVRLAMALNEAFPEN